MSGFTCTKLSNEINFPLALHRTFTLRKIPKGESDCKHDRAFGYYLHETEYLWNYISCETYTPDQQSSSYHCQTQTKKNR